MSNDVNQPEVVNQLSKKLGVKVVLQMENSEGEVVFEDVVSNQNSSNPDQGMSQTVYSTLSVCISLNLSVLW